MYTKPFQLFTELTALRNGTHFFPVLFYEAKGLTLMDSWISTEETKHLFCDGDVVLSPTCNNCVPLALDVQIMVCGTDETILDTADLRH